MRTKFGEIIYQTEKHQCECGRFVKVNGPGTYYCFCGNQYKAAYVDGGSTCRWWVQITTNGGKKYVRWI